MKQYYVNSALLITNLIFSKIRAFKDGFGFENSGKKIAFVLIVFVFFFTENASAQCSITLSRNSTGLVCGTSPLGNCGGVLYIGDGTNAMTLTMTSNLDLTCLGPLRFIIRNGALVDFSSGNYDLALSEGSSIEIESGGQLGAATNCSASDLITIGSVKVASCIGGNALSNFPDLVLNGGYNSINAIARPSSICVSGIPEITATANPPSDATYKWYDAASGGNLLQNGGSTYSPGTITSTTTYYVSATYPYKNASNPAYTTVRKAVTVTVSPNLPASVSIGASPSGAICAGTSVTFTAAPTNGGVAPAYQWYKGTTLISGATSASYVATALANNDVIKVIMTSNATPCLTGSPATSGAITITVNPVSAAPTVGIPTQPDCIVATGSVVLSGLTTSGTVSQTGTGTNSYTITGTTMTVSGLSPGTYNFTFNNGSCDSGATGNVVINSVVTNTWNGTSWSNGTPIVSQAIQFNGGFSSSGDMEACSCQVNSGAVIISSGHTLKITNGVTVSGGSLTFENNASLVQVNDAAVNSGAIIYKRNTTPISNFDYTYWSSPVAGQTLYNLSPDTLGDKFYSFDSGIEDWKQENSGNPMLVGTGYIIRGPQNYAAPKPPGLFEASFKGVPNNGLIKTPMGPKDSSNLIGNPYPSALDANKFLDANKSVIEGTIYFWTHNTNIGIGVSDPGTGLYAYSGDDYAGYNRTGGVGTQATSKGANTNAPSGKIASGQSFFTTSVVLSGADPSAVFNNSMRVDVNGINLDNSQFFKNASNAKAATAIEKNRLWLNLSNSQGAFKQTLVGYITGATNEYESAYDGESYDSNAFLDFYSIYQDKNLVIQGRALPFSDTDQVPLGYSSNIIGALEISIGEVDGLLVDQDVFLEDKLLKIIHNLKNEPYSFTTEKGVFDDRFVLRYTNTTKSLANVGFELVEKGVLVSKRNKELKVNSFSALIAKVSIYDMSGKQIYKNTNVDSKDLVIRNIQSTKQILLVNVELQNGQSVTQKIIY